MEKQFLESVAKLLERELNKLEEEIGLYKNESAIWKTDGAITNTAGNLCLHLCGNLQNYIGAGLGNTGYIRNRPLEFSAKGISRDDLIKEIRKTKQAVLSTLKDLKPEALLKEYPEQVMGYPMSTMYFLIHLQGHLNYHLGQINYHRRLLDR
jgi:hypothetical protein